MDLYNRRFIEMNPAELEKCVKDNMTNEEREKLIYAIEHDLCPECCNVLNYYPYHERDSTYDKWICPKCNWEVLVSDWENVKEQEQIV